MFTIKINFVFEIDGPGQLLITEEKKIEVMLNPTTPLPKYSGNFLGNLNLSHEPSKMKGYIFFTENYINL